MWLFPPSRFFSPIYDDNEWIEPRAGSTVCVAAKAMSDWDRVPVTASQWKDSCFLLFLLHFFSWKEIESCKTRFGEVQYNIIWARIFPPKPKYSQRDSKQSIIDLIIPSRIVEQKRRKKDFRSLYCVPNVLINSVIIFFPAKQTELIEIGHVRITPIKEEERNLWVSFLLFLLNNFPSAF